MVTIDARPETVVVDPQQLALLLVDMQNDFGSVGRMFDRAGIDIGGISAAASATPACPRSGTRGGHPDRLPEDGAGT